jgi:hypothetical protein
MPAIAQKATFSFSGFSGRVTGISVETPTAEVVNMTNAETRKGFMIMVPTGDWTGGTINVDYMVHGGGDIQDLVGKVSALSFSSSAFSVARRAILVSASTEARVGEIVRGSLRFQVTDYQGS